MSQMALVPLYLTYWSAKTYGISLAVLALTNIIQTFDFGHQTYLQYEFLRIGRDNRTELSKYLWSGVCFGILICLAQLAFIIFLLVTGTLTYFLDEIGSLDAQTIYEAELLLLLQGLAWFLSTSIPGVFHRALAPFGYYPRMSWWNFLYAVLSTVAPVVAVVYGAGLLETGIVSFITSITYSIPLYYDMLRLLRKEGVTFQAPSWKLGYHNFVRSLALSAKGLLENIRQQGIRLLLVPMLGANGLAAFSTMRTGANAALKSLNTIANPLMPELMRFLHQRDQARSEIALGTVWVVVVALLAPAVVVMQALAEPLFSAWTRGQVVFDPLLFATLSLGILVYAAAQPAVAIVVGNNLLKHQLGLSLTAVIVLVGTILLLVPTIGMLGGGIALLLAEVVATVGYRIYAQRWLQKNNLAWPTRSANIVNLSVWMAGLSMGLLVLFPNAQPTVVTISLLFLLWNAWRYWQALPDLATQRVRKMLVSVPGVRRLFPA
ncbi:lipopolysaccharide biosynthesis protein [Larkinella arboricola]